MAGENQTLEIYQELVNRNSVPPEHRDTVDELVRRGVLKRAAQPQSPRSGPASTQEIIDYHKRGATPQQQAEIDRAYAPSSGQWGDSSAREPSFLGYVGDTATLGAKDEIFAGIAAPFRAVGNLIRQQPADIGGEYDQQLRLNRIRRDIDKAGYGSGVSGVAGAVAGGALVAPASGALAAGQAVAQPFLRQIATMAPALAVTGAKIGGADAYLSADGSTDPNAGLFDNAAERARSVPLGAAAGAAGAVALGTGLASALRLRDVYRDRGAATAAANQTRFDEARAAGIDNPMPAIVSEGPIMDRATRTSGAMLGGSPVSGVARENINQLSTALNRTLAAPIDGRTAGDLGLSIQDDLRRAVTQRSIPSNRMRDMPSDELQAIAGRVSDEGFEPPRPRVDPVRPRPIDEIQPRDVGPEPTFEALTTARERRQRQLDDKIAEIRAATEQHNTFEAGRAEAVKRYPQLAEHERLAKREQELRDAYDKIVQDGGIAGGFMPWRRSQTTSSRSGDMNGRISPVDTYRAASDAELARLQQEHRAVTAQMKQLEPDLAIAREALARYGDPAQRIEYIRRLHSEREQLEGMTTSIRAAEASNRARYETDLARHSEERQRATAEALEENARRRATAEREANDATFAAQRAADERYQAQIREGNTGFRIGNSRESYPSEISAAYELAGRAAPRGRVLPLGDGVSRTATTRLLDDVAREARGSLAIRDFDGRVFDPESGGLSRPFYDYLAKHINGDMAARINELAMRRSGATAGIAPNDMRNLMRDLRRVEQAIEDSKFGPSPMTGDQALIRRLRGALMEDFAGQLRGMGDVPSFRNAEGDFNVLPGDRYRTRSQLGEDAKPSDATYFVSPEHMQMLTRGDVEAGGRMTSVPATLSLVNEGNRLGWRDNRTGRFDRARLVPFSRQPEPGMVPIQVWDDGHRVAFGSPVVSRPPREGERSASMFQNADRQQAQFYDEIRRPLHKIFGDKVDPVQAMDRLVKAAETGETQMLGAFMRVMSEKSDPRKGLAAIVHHATGGGTNISRFGEFWRGLNPASRRVLTVGSPNQALARELDNFARVGQRLEKYMSASKRASVDVASIGHIPTTTVVAATVGWQAALGLIAANALGARVLTSPRLVRWLTAVPNVGRGGFESPEFARHMARLGAMAGTGPVEERDTARRMHAAFKQRSLN